MHSTGAYFTSTRRVRISTTRETERTAGLSSQQMEQDGLKSVRENSVVPPGLESFSPPFPALKRWAKLGRPSGAGFSRLTAAVNRYATQKQNKTVAAAVKSVRENSVVPPGLESFSPLFPALKRWAKLGRPSGAGFSCISLHRVDRKGVLTHTLKACSFETETLPAWPCSHPAGHGNPSTKEDTLCFRHPGGPC